MAKKLQENALAQVHVDALIVTMSPEIRIISCCATSSEQRHLQKRDATKAQHERIDYRAPFCHGASWRKAAQHLLIICA